MSESDIDMSLPLFVYGALKVDEIAWPQISSYVSSSAAAILEGFILQISDGMAYARKLESGLISGNLLWFDKEEAAYEKIIAFEGTSQRGSKYLWAVAELDGQRANLLVGAKNASTAMTTNHWSTADDEVFSKGLPWVAGRLADAISVLNETKISDPKPARYWDAYFNLQATVLYLWSIQERFELFILGVTDNSSTTDGRKRRTLGDRRRELEANGLFCQAIEAAQIDKTLSVSSYRSIEGRAWSAATNPLSTWYEVRNNISHHAKGSEREVGKVITAAADHFNTLLFYSHLVAPALGEKYEGLTFLKKEM